MAVTNTYDVGDLVRVTGTLSDADGTASDPNGLSVKYKDPSGNTTTLVYGTDAALKRSATGVYYTDIDVDESGYWYYRFASTGTGQSAAEGDFYVSDSRF